MLTTASYFTQNSKNDIRNVNAVTQMCKTVEHYRCIVFMLIIKYSVINYHRVSSLLRCLKLLNLKLLKSWRISKAIFLKFYYIILIIITKMMETREPNHLFHSIPLFLILTFFTTKLCSLCYCC